MFRRPTVMRGIVTLRGFTLDSARYTAKLDGVALTLTPTEFLLLFTLLVHPGWVFTRQQLTDILYPGEQVVSDRAVDSHIKNLRRKLRAIRPTTPVIESLYGIGYRCIG